MLIWGSQGIHKLHRDAVELKLVAVTIAKYNHHKLGYNPTNLLICIYIYDYMIIYVHIHL